MLDNICYNELPAEQWPTFTPAPPAVPSTCAEDLLTFDDIRNLGELCASLLKSIWTGPFAGTHCSAAPPERHCSLHMACCQSRSLAIWQPELLDARQMQSV